MTGNLLIRGVRLGSSDEPVDVVIRDGHLETIGDASPEWSGPTVDGGGRLALPALVDGHAHLDKTLWGMPWRPHSAGPGLDGLITNERRHRGGLPPVAERAAALLGAYLDNGTTRIRSHVDVDPGQGLRAVEGVKEAAARFSGRIDVEVVAFPQSGLLTAPGTADLLEEALRAGADLVGGIDPAGVDGDAVTHLDTIFGIADRHGCGIDLHLHDRGSLGRWELGLVIERTRALAMQGRVTVSHAFCLCDGDPAIEPLLAGLAEQRIALATVAPGPVEPLPLDRLRSEGVEVCLGQDGVRDLWSPWGDADMLHRAAQLAHRAGYRRDEDINGCLDLATSAGARALGVADHGLAPGERADLLLIDAATPAEAVVTHPARDLVVARGAAVAGPLRDEVDSG